MSTSNKTTILQHNERLSVLVDTVENLPDAEEITLESLEVTKNGTYTPDDGVDGFDEVIVSIPTTTQAAPAITVNTDGLITATATQTEGYVQAGTKSATKQLTTQGAKTITPSTLDQIAISQGVYATGNVTVQGDSNLIGANIVKGKSIFGVAGTAETGGGSGGSTDLEDAIVSGTITEYTNDRVTSIGNYAFYSCTTLTTANFLACTLIGNYAFYSCTTLTTANFPACTSIGNSAFYNCRSLATVNFPVCTSIGNSAFCNCAKLTSVNFPACTLIGMNAFYSCTTLTSVNFPVCTSISQSAFCNCSKLTTVNFPVCTLIGLSTFQSCKSLTTVNFPVCTCISARAFYSCTTLTTANFPACISIYGDVFHGCCKLLSLYLNASSVCTLGTSSAFSSTPIAGYTTSTNGVLGSIFVPASLVDAYKTATNWTYFADRITAIPA